LIIFAKIKIMKSVEYTQELADKIKLKYKISEVQLRRWKQLGAIPEKYIEGKNPSRYAIEGVSIFDLRVAKHKRQSEFLNAFNARFGTNVTQALLTLWETGRYKPHFSYQEKLRQYFKGTNPY
jgi:hypothetical protein